jgi:hypothetical protein
VGQAAALLKRILLAVLFALTACAPAVGVVTPQLVKVYITSAASSRLGDLYNCSAPSIAISLSDAGSADITLRLGPPDGLSSPAFQIGTEDVLVIVQSQNSLNQLTANQVHAIFLGQVTNWKDLDGMDMPIQVWTYAQGEDVQQVFEQDVMENQQVTSFARLAVSAQDMLNSVANDPDSIGFLPAAWMKGKVKNMYTVASVPLLAITRSQPQGALKELIACLQK